MTGLFYILCCWALGNALSAVTGRIIPGNIIGMLLLFAALSWRLVPAERVRPAAKFLLANMALFFVPFGVGVMVAYPLILERLWGILAVLAGGLVAVLLVTGHLYQYLNRRK